MERYLKQGAHRFSYLAPEWQEQIDQGLKLDTTIGMLWQQKAMPLFKARKYDLGMRYLNKAVEYDSAYLDYRAFMKCIFAKQYASALEDFALCSNRVANGRLMDHSYAFYAALCLLQLNRFDEALTLLATEVHRDDAKGWTHHLELFYLGVAYYELRQYEKAAAAFDRALAKYPRFSDAQYYKARCYAHLDREKEGQALLLQGKENHRQGHTINEDNSFYEQYPYQVTWQWNRVQ